MLITAKRSAEQSYGRQDSTVAEAESLLCRLHKACVGVVAPDAVLPRPAGGGFCVREQQAQFSFGWVGKKPFRGT